MWRGVCMCEGGDVCGEVCEGEIVMCEGKVCGDV